MICIYSWEIDVYLRSKEWILTKQEYKYISDLNSSPQICRVSYNSYNNDFYMETTDGYNWIFRIKE